MSSKQNQPHKPTTHEIEETKMNHAFSLVWNSIVWLIISSSMIASLVQTQVFAQRIDWREVVQTSTGADTETEGVLRINGKEFEFNSLTETMGMVQAANNQHGSATPVTLRLQTSPALRNSLALQKTPRSPSVFPQSTKTYNNVTHFAIYVDDLKRARTFYENVFAWKFSEWSGIPDFLQIETSGAGDSAIRGALQKRPESHKGMGFNGYECTFSVADVTQIAEAVARHGGKILVAEVEIPTVGRFIKFSDTEGNVACAMQYVKDDR